MKIHFLGAARTVTGSQILIEVNGSKILLECGLFQGKRADMYQFNQSFQFSPKEIDALLLSHAHIDHSGNIPNLVKQGYSNRIFATSATVSLAEIMLRDSGYIQESDVQYVNKKRARRGEPPVDPLYTYEDAKIACDLFTPVEYNQTFEVAKGVNVTYVDSGHILGSASIILDINENGNKKRLWFSGDIGRDRLPLLKDPVMPSNVDYMIMECTYGDKNHRDPETAFQEFREVTMKTIARGGKIIIPAFAVGRTQELVYFLNQMLAANDIPSIPIFVDSPLAINATDIFKKYAHLFDEETRQFIQEGNHKALTSPNLYYTRAVEESKKINEIKGPAIIISASGMAETGRILHHLRNNIENPLNTIMIVSWQAPHTLGKRLAERQKTVRIFGQLFERRAEIATIGGLSAHAGQDKLLLYALETRTSLKGLFLVHGEEDAAQALMDKLEEKQIAPVYFPDRSDYVEI
ncbi:MAG: MBL fold metallo-hydrolase [Chloroflexi bacterium HGW-Chloroflexi-2]|jgi:metallo-beta-lactamase family protein|nr:MAG: MBL fold metallo-hydrolase [Chloroflexi bacterium HGW-Chloroflexi-2]